MKISRLAQELYEEISELEIIDAHEHLPSEANYLSFQYSGPNLFAGYVWHDLESAGMSSEFKATMREGGDKPVDAWWPVVRPYWEHVKYGSYARGLRITARDLFGIADINDSTIGDLAEKVKADNSPGLYERVLGDRCRIRYAITNTAQVGFPDDPILRGVPMIPAIGTEGVGMVDVLSQISSGELGGLDDAVEAAQTWMRARLQEGAVAFKMDVLDFADPDADAAGRELRRALQSPQQSGPLTNLRNYLFDKCLDVAAEADVPVAVHTGVWGDFRKLDPKHMLLFALERRDVRFDLFHLGMPMVRDAAMIGKTLPNVTLNLCWCAILSQLQTKRMLGEIIEMVPLNKVIAFGGDYRVGVQLVYGHLVAAREVVAAVLADRIEAGDFDREYALHVAKLWFHDNPARIYKLDS